MQLPNITSRQDDIIDLIYRFRFLNRSQIQQLMHHKHHRTIHLWLNDLVTKGYLSRIYSRTFPDNTKPAVYYLAKNGIAHLRTPWRQPAHTLYREAQRSEAFIQRCLLLADIALELREAATDHHQTKILTKTDYRGFSSVSILKGVDPDALITERTKDNVEIAGFLLLLEDDVQIRLRRRVKKLLTVYDQNEWQYTTAKPFPTPFIVCPNWRVLTYLAKYIRATMRRLEITGLELQITTREELKEYGFTGDIWDTIRDASKQGR